jgi:hypothetical protein
MVILMFGFIFLSLVVYVISICIHTKKLKHYASILLKQGSITLVLFNCFNVSFSAGIHWKHAEHTDSYYVLSSVMLIASVILMLSAAIAMRFSKVGYG